MLICSFNSVIRENINIIIEKENVEFISHGMKYLTVKIFIKSLAFISIQIFTRLLLPNKHGIL